jgi:hypothetical protein
MTLVFKRIPLFLHPCILLNMHKIQLKEKYLKEKLTGYI